MKQMIGISIGSKNTVVGTLKGKVVDVILSDTSNREVPTAVSYNERDRSFGDLAWQTLKSNWKRTVLYPNRWWGIQKDWPFIEEEAKYSNVKPVFDKFNKIGFEINYKNQLDNYSAESLMGLYFSKLQKNWNREGLGTKEIVVSVPDYYTAYERKAMMEAINIANLKCTSLINESSATSLSYGLLRMRDFDEKTPRTVGFVDMGQSKTTIFFGTFTKKLMKVVSVTSERFLGARDFDYALAEHIAKDFETKYQSNPMKNQKCKWRLLDSVAKIRKSLTVNKEATLNIDSLMDGEDCVYHLTKDEFEKIIEPLLMKFKNWCLEALKRAGEEAKLQVADWHSVEMVGATVRTPIIQGIIKEVFGKEISKTLPPDECISRGCTWFAAMNSPYFSIQNYTFEHYNPYTIILEYPYLKNGEVQTRTHQIIKRGENIPGKKSIKFNEKQTPQQDIIPLKFYYSKDEINWLPNLMLRGYNVNLPKSQEESWTFALSFVLDINCLPELTHASLDEVYYEIIPVKKPEEPKKEETIEGHSKQEQEKGEENSNGETKKEDAKKEEPQKEEPKKEEPKKPEEPKTVKKNRLTSLQISSVDLLYGTSRHILEQFLQREVSQEDEDKVYHLVSHKKNELEQFIYNTREKFQNVWIPYVTESEKTELSKHMDILLEWWYSDDEGKYVKSTLESKSKDMMDLGNKIYSRYNNWNMLEQNIHWVNQTINKAEENLKAECEKIASKQSSYWVESDIKAINDIITLGKNSAVDAQNKYDSGVKTKEPELKPWTVQQGREEIVRKIEKVYADAQFRVEEAERKRKEEEARIKKEEEEKKKKEEQEKKKEEEDKEKKKKTDVDKGKESTNKEDVTMKDASAPAETASSQSQGQKEEKDGDAMDVE